MAWTVEDGAIIAGVVALATGAVRLAERAIEFGLTRKLDGNGGSKVNGAGGLTTDQVRLEILSAVRKTDEYLARLTRTIQTARIEMERISSTARETFNLLRQHDDSARDFQQRSGS
jgi:hypothetical protein